MTTETRLLPRIISARATATLVPHDASEARAVITLSAEDLAAYRASQESVTARTAPGDWVPVTDTQTGQQIKVRAASCGLRCVCDMEVTL